MKANEQIILLGDGLKDRLRPELINMAIEYIEFSEIVLAFETLCDHIADYDVVINNDEYSKIIKIANELGLEMDDRYTYINPEK
ncbi:MAG: MafI family immunity protein [Limnobaculum xujianqingii]